MASPMQERGISPTMLYDLPVRTLRLALILQDEDEDDEVGETRDAFTHAFSMALSRMTRLLIR